MRIALIDSFFDTSHKLWADGLVKYSAHNIDIYAGSAHHWKWKMTGGTYELAQQFVAADKSYDILLVSDMVNLPLFRSMLTPALFSIPVVLYFHENQITYPWGEGQHRRDRNYGWINYMSACQADVCLYNSQYHLQSFTEALPIFLKPFPKFNWRSDLQRIVDHSHVAHIGLELPTELPQSEKSDIPVFIWNHRWEYDKAPQVFFNTLMNLSKRGVDFQLIVVGKGYKRVPPIFAEARTALEKHIVHWGWVDTKQAYIDLLLKANVIFVTNVQDFFGISIIEAIAHGCLPVLPNRLAYPEHVDKQYHNEVFYNEEDDLTDNLSDLISSKAFQETSRFSNYVMKYDWSNMISRYDIIFEEVLNRS